MMKWWIERENGNFDHVSADALDVSSGALVFKRLDVPVLVVAAGTYVSVSIDEDVDLDALAPPRASSVLTHFVRSGRTKPSASRGLGVGW